MASIKGKDTKPELAMAAELARRGIPYRSQASDLPGKPDFAIDGAMVAVLCDGGFWHGFDFANRRHKLDAKWQRKIRDNMRRDARNRKALKGLGWTVVRLWDHAIRKDAKRCGKRVAGAIKRAAAQSGIPRITELTATSP